MQTYTTKNHTTLYYDVYYTKGGFTNWAGQTVKRGYYLDVMRMPNRFLCFTGLENPEGSVRMLILPVGRQSKKRAAESEAMALDKLQGLLARDYPEL